jgi:uncharacterized protein with HEPN domain
MFIEEGITLIQRRCKGIDSADDFLFNDENLDKFEASIMRLQTVGEALKNIDKRDEKFLLQVASKDYWREIIRMRDLISHHYSDIQADIIFSICKEELDELEQNIQKLKEILL